MDGHRIARHRASFSLPLENDWLNIASAERRPSPNRCLVFQLCSASNSAAHCIIQSVYSVWPQLYVNCIYQTGWHKPYRAMVTQSRLQKRLAIWSPYAKPNGLFNDLRDRQTISGTLSLSLVCQKKEQICFQQQSVLHFDC